MRADAKACTAIPKSRDQTHGRRFFAFFVGASRFAGFLESTRGRLEVHVSSSHRDGTCRIVDARDRVLKNDGSCGLWVLHRRSRDDLLGAFAELRRRLLAD